MLGGVAIVGLVGFVLFQLHCTSEDWPQVASVAAVPLPVAEQNSQSSQHMSKSSWFTPGMPGFVGSTDGDADWHKAQLKLQVGPEL